MSKAQYSAALIGGLNEQARAHLLRLDGHEDLCFALWYPSQGRSRTTALIHELILPLEGERHVHGNASLEPAFLERALALGNQKEMGLALMHSHPDGRGWQGMSSDDIATENGMAAAVYGGTGLPLVGMTLAGDGAWGARFWNRTAPRTYERADCATVRVLADDLSVTYCDRLAPRPEETDEQLRTVASWGKEVHENLTRLRIGIIGSGSVGGMIGDALARTGFEDVVLLDFDTIERHNLDRLTYADRDDIGQLKVEVQARHLRRIATAVDFRVEPIPAAVYEEAGFRAALDCDVLFSCVDRPWGRYALNTIAYAHLVPVIDGGISVGMNRLGRISRADWTALTATPGRQCLECAGQFDMNLVQMEREGLLDDPSYIEGLPRGHGLKAQENVFGFSMACASLQFLQMLALAISPLNQPDSGRQIYHFVGSTMEPPDMRKCGPDCRFTVGTGRGDRAGIEVAGSRPGTRQNLAGR